MILLCFGLLSFLYFAFLDRKLDKESEYQTKNEEEFKLSDIWAIVKIRAFWIITALCALFYSALFPFIKYATMLIVQKFGVSDEFAGLIPALLPLGALVLTPIFGNMYDRKGKGATIMIVGSVILFAVHLLFSIPYLNSLYLAIGLVLLLSIAFSLVPSAMWPSVAKIIPEQRVGTAYAIIFWVQNWGIMGIPMLIGLVLKRYCVLGNEEKIIDGQLFEVTQYDYLWPMLIFAAFGALAIFFAWWLKSEDARKGYGLENPNRV
jgi:predicted MFS family arabinose efflux permease